MGKLIFYAFCCLIVLQSCQSKTKTSAPKEVLATAQDGEIYGNAKIITLPKFNAKKLVAYQFEKITIYVRLEDFQKELQSLWAVYKDNSSFINENEKPKSVIEHRFQLLDSTMKVLQTNKSDTIYIDHQRYAKYEFAPLINFSKHIEQGTCAITDHRNIRQYQIIKRKVSSYEGKRFLWDGRRYFFVADTKYFYEVTDMIS